MALQIISIYRSQSWGSARLFEEIKKIIDYEKNTLIVGDFNICFKENYTNQLIQGLLNMGFVQLIHETTHMQGRIIDHAYFRDHTNKMKIHLDRHSPYYSDHDAFCIIIKPCTAVMT